MKLVDICKMNDISVEAAEKSLSNLQQKGIITGYVPGDIDAEIILAAESAEYFKDPL